MRVQKYWLTIIPSKSSLRPKVLGEDVAAKPTGHSAYRAVVKTSDLQKEESFTAIINPRDSVTTMVMGHSRRMIMGPARSGEVYSVVAMVPDPNPDVESNSWTTSGDLESLLEEFEAFPDWAKAPFRHCKDIGLWQLRDNDPLKTWYRGRVILIGDAAHAMLPTQGQGASQSIEDAEALGAFFADIKAQPTADEVQRRLQVSLAFTL